MVVNPAPLGAVPENVSRAPRGMKSPCTRSQMRRNPDSRERLASPGCEPSLTLDDLPDELVLHALTHGVHRAEFLKVVIPIVFQAPRQLALRESAVGCQRLPDAHVHLFVA